LSGQADDYAAANIGQLKYIAAKASAELAASLPAGTESKFTRLVASWSAGAAAGVTRDDYAALTQGQLKAVGAIFYEHLSSIGYYGAPLKPYARYPWTSSTSDDDNFSVVNIGQLKYVFSFSSANYIPTNFSTDSDSDGMPDWWEIERGLDKNNPADASIVTGGQSNLQAYQAVQSAGGDPANSNLVGILVYSP
jgi:hypothetical protein